MAEMGIALQLYTLRDHLKTAEQIRETLLRVREIGYRAVQLSGLGPIEPEPLKALLDEADLVCCATHTGWERLQTDLEAVVAEHRVWDCTHIAIGGLPGEYRSAEGYRRFAEEGSDIGRKLAPAGMTFSYHNHYWELEKYDGRRGLDIIYEDGDPGALMAELDTYWLAFTGADPIQWINRVAGRMPVVHFKDMTISGDEQIMTEVGEGNLNWPGIIEACGAAGVEWCAVEQDVCTMDHFESVAISYRNLARMGLS